MNALKPPRFVRVINPLPGEEGRLLLYKADVAGDEYRVALRDGSLRSYQLEQIAAWEP